MPLPDTPPALSTEAILAGDAGQLAMLLQQLFVQGDSAAAAGNAAFVDLFWAQWRRHCGLHAEALDVLEPLRAQLAADLGWVGGAQHAVWSLLATLQQVAVGYQPELGRAGEKLLAELQRWPALAGAQGWAMAASTAAAAWEQEQQRIARLEQRLIDVERGQLRTRRAQQQAARLLNQQTAGKKLPAVVAEFLHGEWYRELQWCLLQFGEGSPQWRQRRDLTGRLVASLQPPGDDAAERQSLYAVIPEVGPELREVLAARAHDQHSLEAQLTAIEEQHLLLLRGQPLRYAPFSLIAQHDPWLSSSTTISSDLLARVDELAPGQWFLHSDAPQPSRIKLLLKMDDTSQLLCVNRAGVKALQQSFEEFAYLLATGAATPLPGPQVGLQLLRQLVKQLVHRYREQTEARSLALAEERARQEAQAQRRSEAKAKAEAEAKALADTEARLAEESAQHARAQEVARRRELIEHQGGDPAQRQRAARQSAALLPIGSWVELHDELGRSQLLKLAVKLPSTSKLIFVDRDGMRRAELVVDVFVERLLEGSARILEQGLQFEDTLARVVGNLRRDRAERSGDE